MTESQTCKEESRHRRGNKRLLLKPHIRTKLLEALRVGATNQIACQYAGIEQTTFYRAMARARDGDPTWTPLLRECEEATSKRAVECLAGIRADNSWESKKWFLERRYPRDFALRPERFEETTAGEVADATDGEPMDLRTAEGRQRAVDLLAAMPPAILAAALARHTGVGETK